MKMKMKRKVKRSIAATKIAATFYCYFCCRHILITFVGMTLLIVNYGVDTVLMSDVPHGNGNSNSSSYSNGKSYNNNNTNNKYTVITNKNGFNIDNNYNNTNSDDIYKFIIRIANDENIMTTDIKQKNNNKNNINENANLLQISLLQFLTANKDNNDTRTNAYDAAIDLYVDSNNSSNSINDTLPLPSAEVFGQLGNFRKARIFGLLGTNFSLSYNLSLATGNSVGNITIAAPAAAPAYYYSAAPYYPYGYGYDPYGYGYNPYGYYNPYAYNPYAYNPYAGYGYYG